MMQLTFSGYDSYLYIFLSFLRYVRTFFYTFLCACFRIWHLSEFSLQLTNTIARSIFRAFTTTDSTRSHGSFQGEEVKLLERSAVTTGITTNCMCFKLWRFIIVLIQFLHELCSQGMLMCIAHQIGVEESNKLIRKFYSSFERHKRQLKHLIFVPVHLLRLHWASVMKYLGEKINKWKKEISIAQKSAWIIQW